MFGRAAPFWTWLMLVTYAVPTLCSHALHGYFHQHVHATSCACQRTTSADQQDDPTRTEFAPDFAAPPELPETPSQEAVSPESVGQATIKTDQQCETCGPAFDVGRIADSCDCPICQFHGQSQWSQAPRWTISRDHALLDFVALVLSPDVPLRAQILPRGPPPASHVSI